MTLLNCPECDDTIGDQASTCPRCGLSVTTVKMKEKQEAARMKKEQLKTYLEEQRKEQKEKKISKRNEMLYQISAVMLAIRPLQN